MFTGIQVRKYAAKDDPPIDQVEEQEESKEEMTGMNQVSKYQTTFNASSPIEADSLPEKEKIITGVRF
jgi:hypothetical protein